MCHISFCFHLLLRAILRRNAKIRQFNLPNHGVSAVQMKNCDPFVFGPALAMELRVRLQEVWVKQIRPNLATKDEHLIEDSLYSKNA